MTATRVKALKVGMGYAYPSDILVCKTCVGTASGHAEGYVQVAIDGNLPFKRPIFAKVIYEAFFQRGEKGKAALATGKEDVFTSSVYLKPHEKEMIPNIVALACAGVSRHLTAAHSWFLVDVSLIRYSFLLTNGRVAVWCERTTAQWLLRASTMLP